MPRSYDSGEDGNKATLPRQSSNMITFWLASNIVLTLRTSGTEPKIKFYSEIIRENVTGAQAKDEVKAALEKTVHAVVYDLLQVEEYKLQPKSS
jgi:phosphomannomutase